MQTAGSSMRLYHILNDNGPNSQPSRQRKGKMSWTSTGRGDKTPPSTGYIGFLLVSYDNIQDAGG